MEVPPDQLTDPLESADAPLPRAGVLAEDKVGVGGRTRPRPESWRNYLEKALPSGAIPSVLIELVDRARILLQDFDNQQIE